MIIGFGMCLLGFTTKMMWWTFGGLLLFYMGVMALDPEKTSQEADSAPVGARTRLTTYETLTLCYFAYTLIICVLLLNEGRVTPNALLMTGTCVGFYGVLRVMGTGRRGGEPENRPSPVPDNIIEDRQSI